MNQITARACVYLDRDRVRRLRLMAGFASDESLARAAGISHGHLWQCLAGRTPAGSKVLTGLMRALPGASLDEFVDSESATDSAVSA